jgi:hypothetical protein
LIQNTLDGSRRDGLALGLAVVMDDLQQVMFCILEDDEYAFFCQNDLHGVHDIGMS